MVLLVNKYEEEGFFINTLVVNLIGAPGSGKSTGAAYIYSKLKLIGVNCELVTEVAKDLVWEDNTTALSDQIYVIGEQHRRMSRLINKVDVIVTDSPIILTKIYNPYEGNLKNGLNNLCEILFENYNNMNFVINRTKEYIESGRQQTESQSNKIATEIEKIMVKYPYYYVNGDASGYDTIIKMVTDYITEPTEKLDEF